MESGGYVYFIAARPRGDIKIGLAKDVRARLATLQTASPQKLVLLGVIEHEDAAGLERHIHGVFAAERVRGEWFTASADLKAFIARHAVPMVIAPRPRGPVPGTTKGRPAHNRFA